MVHAVDLNELHQAVGRVLGANAANYSARQRVIIAAGPVTVATLVRAFLTRHKLVSGAVAAGGVWLMIQGLAAPALGLIRDQFGYLQGILGTFGR